MKLAFRSSCVQFDSHENMEYCYITKQVEVKSNVLRHKENCNYNLLCKLYLIMNISPPNVKRKSCFATRQNF